MAFYKDMRMQQENVDTGRYQVAVVDRLSNRPIENARVRISYTGGTGQYNRRGGDGFFRSNTCD